MTPRRQFLKTAGALTLPAIATGASGSVAIAVDPGDLVAARPPVRWALDYLARCLAEKGIEVSRHAGWSEIPNGRFCIAAGDLDAATGTEAESCALIPRRFPSGPVLMACGHDERGLMYAVLDLADRVRHSADPMKALTVARPVVEKPANRVRSIARLFTSDVEDKPWFNDREMWGEYLTMLATQRFNRFHLALGIGYDFLREVTDAYFVFAYPFFMRVPGYDVRVPQLADAERDQNLAMLRFISEQTVARGMHFQLGLWMHGYEWINSPKPNYTIAGITRENHGAYCRDAVRALLQACPAVGGITFRVHGESGVEEGSYEFWRTVFAGVATCGRKVEIDMHAKGMDQTMIDMAVATKQPVKISPKFWAEHMGMPYHQADIRDQEVPKAGRAATGLMKFSAGSRSFLRYGYGDLLRENRQWGVLHRIWPGTQRLLLWGDPATASAYSRAFSFCGSDGVDVCEPLSFKGRRGSGHADGRNGYEDPVSKPRWDWEKYLYTYRVWGRLLYNPASDSDVWKRYLAAEFPANAAAVEGALASASRILPLVTTAHGPSAANNTYWPEVYTNMPLATESTVYRDTPVPRVFGNVSPFDPQMFSRMNDHADELLNGARSGKVTPVEVALWLEEYADAAAKLLAAADAAEQAKARPAYRRFATDVYIELRLGRFFAAKFRAGVLYRVFEKTGDRGALEQCIAQYRKARGAWVELAAKARGVYVRDITVGELTHLRGHWLDRMPAIDADIAELEKKLAAAKVVASDAVTKAVAAAVGNVRRAAVQCSHSPVAKFRPGQAVAMEVTARAEKVRLHYRHVTQAARWVAVEMRRSGERFVAEIPAAYATGEYPLQYYFEVFGEEVGLYPGFGEQRMGQPYFVMRRT
ncbi:MAG: hypothetical protein HY820_07710 [Acidobacteria bacterium]|nr:hypothetical protein [Acidobacteriota bacterium]